MTLTDCDSEPVQTPGCVQAHGAMLVLRRADLVVLQASENTEALLGRGPAALLSHPVEAALGAAVQGRIAELVATQPIDRNPLYLLTLPRREGYPPLDVTVHSVDDVVVVELEATGRSSASAPDYYALVKRTVARLQTAERLQQFCDLTAEEFRSLSELDPVMVYRFHGDGHGEVFAESKRADLPPWLGLHYPAEDIPRPAREIFKQVWIRPVPDVAGGLAELVPLTNPDTGAPLTMTFAVLRGPSIMYTE